MIRVAIAGIDGRMGRAVAPLLAADPGLSLAGGVARPGADTGAVERRIAGELALGVPVVDRAAQILPAVDVLLDFTNPAAALEHAQACRAAARPFVTGTTGLTADQLDELREIARDIAVFQAANFSLGIAAILQLLPELLAALPGYDVEIVETHHRGKIDAPSGTALALAEAAQAGGRSDWETVVFGRRGSSRRSPGEIGIHAVRGGGNPGEHTLLLAGEDEQVTIGHRAFSRRAYARGALEAARFVAGRAPGLYGMEDLMRERRRG